VVRDLNGENVWGVNGGLDPAIEEFTAELNMKLGKLHGTHCFDWEIRPHVAFMSRLGRIGHHVEQRALGHGEFGTVIAARK